MCIVHYKYKDAKLLSWPTKQSRNCFLDTYANSLYVLCLMYIFQYHFLHNLSFVINLMWTQNFKKAFICLMCSTLIYVTQKNMTKRNIFRTIVLDGRTKGNPLESFCSYILRRNRNLVKMSSKQIPYLTREMWSNQMLFSF